MAIRKQRPGDDARPEWKRPPLTPEMRAMFERRLSVGELATRVAAKREERPRHRLEREARNQSFRDPVREAIAEATRDEPDPFGALVDLAESLDIDVVLLVTATVASELVRQDRALVMPGRPALDATDAGYLLCLLDSYRHAAEVAATSPDPVEAALASLSRDWGPVREEHRETATRLAAKVKGRGHAALTVALNVLRDEEPDLVRVFVGKRTATEARKRLRLLAERDTESTSDARWLEVKARAAKVIRSASRT